MKKVTTVLITVHFLKSNDDNDTRYRFSIVFKNLTFFQQSCGLDSPLPIPRTSNEYIRSKDAMFLNCFFMKRVAKMLSPGNSFWIK